MKRNVELDEVIKSRIKESKVFTKQEISIIISNINLLTKCYILGVSIQKIIG